MTGAEDPLAVARGELGAGERLVWADQPAARSRNPLPIILFGLVFVAFAVFWTLQALEASLAMAAVGVVFAGIGIGLATRPFWRGERGRIVYAITDRRLMILREEGGNRRVRSLQPADIEFIERRERADGTGDVVFAQETVLRDDVRLRRDGPPNLRSSRREIGFFRIREAKKVEDAIRALRDGRAPAA